MLGLLFLIICTIQILFLITAFSAIKKVQSELAFNRQKNKNLSVSIVICVHNELHNLKKLLPLLYQQDYFRKEIIIVDDQSIDGTKDFLQHETLSYPELIVVSVNEDGRKRTPGKKKAVELGVLLAQHEIILLTDADCRPNSSLWVQAMCSQFVNDNVQIVLGFAPYFKQKGLLNAFIQYETLYTAIMYLSAAMLGNPYMGVGRNLAYRKSLFIKSGGFGKHHSIIGGDDDLFVNQHANGNNTRVALEVEAQVKSIPQTSWKNFLNQKHRHLEAGKFYRFSDKVWLGTAVLSHLFFWICFCLLLIYNFDSPYIIVSGFLIRTLCLIIVYRYTGLKLNDPISLKSLVILDFLFVIYYVITGTKAFFFKKRRWK